MTRQSGIIFAGLVGMAALIPLFVTADARGSLRERAAQLAQLQAQYENLQLRVSAQTQGATLTVPDTIGWQGESAMAIDILMQDAIIAIAGTSGMALSSFGSSGFADKGPIPSPAYSVEMDGGHDNLVAFLAEIERHEPAFAVDGLSIRHLSIDTGEPIARVTAQMSLWGIAPDAEASAP